METEDITHETVFLSTEQAWNIFDALFEKTKCPEGIELKGISLLAFDSDSACARYLCAFRLIESKRDLGFEIHIPTQCSPVIHDMIIGEDGSRFFRPDELESDETVVILPGWKGAVYGGPFETVKTIPVRPIKSVTVETWKLA